MRDTPSQITYDLEVRLRAGADKSYLSDMSLDDPDSAVSLYLASNTKINIDFENLLEHSLDARIYGQRISSMLFANGPMREGLIVASGRLHRQNSILRFRLRIDDDIDALQALHWETLQHPQTGAFLATDERIVFSRYLVSPDATPVTLPSRNTLRALLLVANPKNLDQYNLRSIDSQLEIDRAKVALSSLPNIEIGSESNERSYASITRLTEAARHGYDIVYLVAHGRLYDGETIIFLEAEDGKVNMVLGTEIVTALSQVIHRPVFIIVASCQSAGAEGERLLNALGPQLLRAGIPAVLAMYGRISQQAVAAMMPVFFREIQQDGLVDRALAVARAAAQHLDDWWQPVLFSRLRHGRIWHDQTTTPKSRLDAGQAKILRQLALRHSQGDGEPYELVRLAADLTMSRIEVRSVLQLLEELGYVRYTLHQNGTRRYSLFSLTKEGMQILAEGQYYDR